MLKIEIEFEELLKVVGQLSVEQKRILKEQLSEEMIPQNYAVQTVPQERIPGLHAGMIWISDDFDDPLPDEFWLGEDT